MQDAAIELYAAVAEAFADKVENNAYIVEFLEMLDRAKATFPDVQKYCRHIGETLGTALADTLTENTLPDGRLYWNIADRVVRPMINQNYDLVNWAAAEVQKILDQTDGIGLNAVRAARPDERIKGLLDNMTVEGLEFAEVQQRMTVPVENITESFFDDFIRENAVFRYEAGMYPQIVRILAGKNPCKWCKALAGVYDYEEIGYDGQVDGLGYSVYQRHENCHCQVYFKNNRERYLQGVHTKRIVRDQTAISTRALLNLDVVKKG